MSTAADLIAMNGTAGSRPTDWTLVSGGDALDVFNNSGTPRSSSTSPRTGTTMFGYGSAGTLNVYHVDEFRRDFTAAEQTDIATGNAYYEFFGYIAKDTNLDGDDGYMEVEFFDASNVSVGGPFQGPTINPASEFGVDTWGRISAGVLNVPTTATYAELRLASAPKTSGSTSNVLWDDLEDSFEVVTSKVTATPLTAGLVVFSEAANSSLNPEGGPRATQLAGLAVIETSSPAELAATPAFEGLVVFEYGPDTDTDMGGPATSQFAGLVVWGQNVREQLNIRSWGFELDGHVFVIYSFGTQGTFVYDDLTGTWSKWYTQGFGNQLNAENGIYWYDGRYVAAAIQDPTVVEMNFDSEFDDGFRTIQRVVTGLVTLKHRDQTLDVGALHVDASVGAPSLTEPNPPGPRMRLRYSDDEGNTWSDYENVSLTVGDFQQDVQWRSLGTIQAPGRIFEISDEGGVVRIDGAWIDTYGDDDG